MKKKLELVVSVAIVIVVILLVVSLMNRSRSSNTGKKAQSPTVRVRPGAGLALPGIDWARNRQTVLIFLTRECQFCMDSAPFYQRLGEQLSGGGQLVAITPDPVSVAGPFLKEHDILVDDLIQAAPSALGIRIVPTVVAVNESGTVTGMWNGKLADGQEQEVLDHLRQASTSAAADVGPDIEPAELRRLIDSGGPVQVLDVRQRSDYKTGHIPGAKNIPVDELEARAGNELSNSIVVVIYCECDNDELSEIARQIISSRGFRKTAILSGGLTAWRDAGLETMN